MLKKFAIILVLFALIIAGLQLFGGRDFGQSVAAWEKYEHYGEIGRLLDDIVIIFSGEKISEGGLAIAKLSERLIYRWTDENGIVHNSERMPKVDKYEIIRMGDVSIGTQKAMDKEEIDKALNGN